MKPDEKKALDAMIDKVLAYDPSKAKKKRRRKNTPARKKKHPS